jgi:hypothetical protein
VIRIGSAVLKGVAAVLIVGVIGFMYACSVPLWPLWLVGMSLLGGIGYDRQEAGGSGTGAR